jgi:hypothetical protein
MGYGDSRVGRNGVTRRNPRHDFKGDAGVSQHLRLFSSTPKHKRVATLQTANQFARTGTLHQKLVGLSLSQAIGFPAPAYANLLRIGARETQQFLIHQKVVYNSVGALKNLLSFER